MGVKHTKVNISNNCAEHKNKCSIVVMMSDKHICNKCNKPISSSIIMTPQQPEYQLQQSQSQPQQQHEYTTTDIIELTKNNSLKQLKNDYQKILLEIKRQSELDTYQRMCIAYENKLAYDCNKYYISKDECYYYPSLIKYLISSGIRIYCPNGKCKTHMTSDGYNPEFTFDDICKCMKCIESLASSECIAIFIKID